MERYEFLLNAIYDKYNPEKRNDVPKFLEKYAGNEEELIDKVIKKYNVSKDWIETITKEAEKPIKENDFHSDEAATEVLKDNLDVLPESTETDIHLIEYEQTQNVKSITGNEELISLETEASVSKENESDNSGKTSNWLLPVIVILVFLLAIPLFNYFINPNRSVSEAIDTTNAVPYISVGGDSVLEATMNNVDEDLNIITIGTQVWMTENLNVDRFRNGDPIPEAKTPEEWKLAGERKQPAWCYYDNDPRNGAKYGKLYNWYAVNDPRGLAPKGWHIPTDAEWTELIDYSGGEEKAGAKMKSKEGWSQGGNGTNSNLFSGLLGGFRNYAGTFHAISKNGYWWSSTENDAGPAWLSYLNYGLGGVSSHGNNETSGFSVRCLRD